MSRVDLFDYFSEVSNYDSIFFTFVTLKGRLFHRNGWVGLRSRLAGGGVDYGAYAGAFCVHPADDFSSAAPRVSSPKL